MNFLKNIKRAAFVLVGLCLCIGSVRSFPAAAEEEAEGLIMPPAVVLRADTAADCIWRRGTLTEGTGDEM